jgi:hypothetical protein
MTLQNGIEVTMARRVAIRQMIRQHQGMIYEDLS